MTSRYGTPGRYITLYCKAASHEGEPWIIGTWTEGRAPDGARYWRYSPDQYLMGAFIRSATERHEPSRVVEGVDGPVWRADDDSTAARRGVARAAESASAIYTERLRCHRCGDGVKRTSGNLHRDLDRLADAGVSDVSLDAYRAAMR